MWERKVPFKALIAIFWDLQLLWPSSLTKPDLLRFRCFSGDVLSKTKSVIPHFFFYFSDITNSSSFDSKIFRKKSMLENFGANVLNGITCTCLRFPYPKLFPLSQKNQYKELQLPFVKSSFNKELPNT